MEEHGIYIYIYIISCVDPVVEKHVVLVEVCKAFVSSAGNACFSVAPSSADFTIEKYDIAV